MQVEESVSGGRHGVRSSLINTSRYSYQTVSLVNSRGQKYPRDQTGNGHQRCRHQARSVFVGADVLQCFLTAASASVQSRQSFPQQALHTADVLARNNREIH